MTSDQIVMETRENTEDIKGLIEVTTKLRNDFIVESGKRHDVHEELLKENHATKELLNKVVDLNKDVNAVMFGCEKLGINGLVADNAANKLAHEANKNFNKKLTWMWAGMGVLVGAAMGAMAFYSKVSKILEP